MDTIVAPLAAIGVDIGKDVFHLVGFGTDGKIAFRRKINQDRFGLGLQASGIAIEDDVLTQLSDIAAYAVDSRFAVSTIQQRSWWIRLVGGPVQFITLALGVATGTLLMLGLVIPRASFVAPQLAELIPFSGFFGTLLGMSRALDVFGVADISDDTSKALNLGQIGGQLSLAISTTIWAIICFGVVMLLKVAIDFVADRTPA